MGRALTFAIGIAAIDALLCAFVAMFAMAIVLQETEAPARQSSSIGMFELQLRKRATTPTDPIEMQAGVSLEAKGCAKIWLLQSEESKADPCGLKAVWRDCKSDNGPCQARLLIQGIKPGMDIVLQMSALDSVPASGRARQEIVSIDALLFDGQTDRKLPPSSLKLGEPQGICYRLRVDSAGQVEWMPVSPSAKAGCSNGIS